MQNNHEVAETGWRCLYRENVHEHNASLHKIIELLHRDLKELNLELSMVKNENQHLKLEISNLTNTGIKKLSWTIEDSATIKNKALGKSHISPRPEEKQERIPKIECLPAIDSKF